MFAKVFMMFVLLSMLACLVGSEVQEVGYMPRAIDNPVQAMIVNHRTPPNYTFSRTPISLMNSYNDYMIGSYNGLPLRVVPESAGGGYFMTYHGQRSATMLRRVFYAYINSSGIVTNNSEITLDNIREGFPTLAVDPVSGKPIYAWHSNIYTDAELEVVGLTDAFIDGIDGLWNEYQPIVNNPTTVGLTTDNEFLWPTAIIGPSPITGKRRVYVVSRNNVSHALDELPSENVIIAYADFNAYDVENCVPFVWSTTTIPTLNQWNTDVTNLRRPNMNLVCDDAGNLYYFGYHSATDANDNPIIEPDVDVFKCTAYGAGTWQRQTYSSLIPTWNPPSSPGGTEYFVNTDTSTPFPDEQLNWKIANSSHCNATIDQLGRIHLPGLWSISTDNGTYYSDMQFVKEMVYNPAALTLTVRDVYPQKDPQDTFNQTYCPWDLEYPWGEVDEYVTDNNGSLVPLMTGDWNFPYWNAASHDYAMMYHCSNMKITECNEQGMMAMVWQNSNRARMFNEDQDVDYEAYANTPEIFISVSADSGLQWLEPIVINNIDTAAFAGIKPMWVYPADKIKFVGMQGENKVGKLGLMFYDDNTWGSSSHSPSEFPIDGGRVMFCELQITFCEGNTFSPQNISMSNGWNWVSINRSLSNNQISDVFSGVMNRIETIKNPDGIFQPNNPFSTLSSLAQGKGYVVQTNATSNLTVYGAPLNPSMPIPLRSGWNLCAYLPMSSCSVSEALSSISQYVLQVKGTAGVYIPGNPANTLTTLDPGQAYWIKTSAATTLVYPSTGKEVSEYSLPTCEIWGSPIVKSNSEVILVSVEGDAGSGDVIAAFANDELRGLATVSVVDGKYAALLQVFTDVEGEPLQFKLFSSARNQIHTLSPMLLSSPGETLGDYSIGEYVSFETGSTEIPILSTTIVSAYPNPFREATSIALEVAKDNTHLGVSIYNLRGQKVRTLFEGALNAGTQKLDWNGCDDKGSKVATGMYFCRLTGTGNKQSIKLMVLK